MSELLFTLIYLGILLLPGYSLSRKVSGGWLLSLSLSYASFCLIFALFNYFSFDAQWLMTTAIVMLSASVLYLFIKTRVEEITAIAVRPATRYVFYITSASVLYQLIIGAFTEVPADLFNHLERFQSALRNLSNGSLGQALALDELLRQKSGVYYYLLANAAFISGISTTSMIELVDFLNRTLFLICVFYFAKAVFNASERANQIALISTFFVFVHMGINVFAFARYYTLAPVIINLVFYFSVMALFIRLLQQPSQLLSLKHWGVFLSLTAVFTVSAATVHVQEALFIAVMIPCTALVVIARAAFGTPIYPTTRHLTPLITLLGLAFTAFAAVYLISIETVSRAPNLENRLWEFSPGFGLLPPLTTLNLSFQFSEVITLWGMGVYVLFVGHFRRYKDNPFVIAGMISPLLTILNPFFVDVFLRHYNSTTLWRLCYLIPIHYVAADLFVHYDSKLRQKPKKQWALSISVLLLLSIPLLPIFNTWNGVHFSRMPTLKAAEVGLSHHDYSDLIEVLSNIEPKQSLLTDPMTGYMITGLTPHRSERRKFVRNALFKRFTFDDYSGRPLKRYKDHLLVVNKRPQSMSWVGAYSKHWSHREWLNTQYYYPNQLLDHLANNSDDFELIWSDNNIWLYLIK